MKEGFSFHNIKDFVGDDNETIQEMVGIFLQSVPESLQLLNESYQNKDYRKLSYYAHKLKSSIDLLDIEELKSEIREIETNSNQLKDTDKLHRKIENLNAVLSSLLPKIKEESDKLI